MFGKGINKPKKTAEELALDRRTQIALDKTIGDQEDMLKSLARGKLGRASLLSSGPKTAQEAASGKRTGGASSAGNLLGGRGGSKQPISAIKNNLSRK